MTAGLDLGDKYSYLCLIDQESAEVIEEGRLRTTPRCPQAPRREDSLPRRQELKEASGGGRGQEALCAPA